MTLPLSTVVADLESGARPKGGVSAEGDVLSLGGEHIGADGQIDIRAPKRISREFYNSMVRGRIAAEDILVVKDGATTGKVAFVDHGQLDDAAVNEHVFRIKVDATRAFPKYVFHFLASPIGQREILKDFRGATVGGIGRGFVDLVHIPLPTLAEQRRIAGILDKADAIRRKRKQAIALTEDLLRSAFLDMFGDPVTNPKGWPVKPLAQLGRITTGNTPSRGVPDYFGDAIEWIKSDNINTPGHFLTRAAEGLSDRGRAVARTAPAGSTLITCIAGSPDCIGNVALADREVAFNQQINAVTPNCDVDYRFLYVLLLVGKRLVQAASTNSMKGMVSKGKLEDVRVPEPSPKLQEKFGWTFDGIVKICRQQEDAERTAQRLYESASYRAFSRGAAC